MSENKKSTGKVVVILLVLLLLIGGAAVCVSLCGGNDTSLEDSKDTSTATESVSDSTQSPMVSEPTESDTTSEDTSEPNATSEEPSETSSEDDATDGPHVHEYTLNVTPPTCTEKGYTTHTCRCGDTYTDSETNPTEHSMGIWSLITEPQCEATGVETRTCSLCGKQESRSISATGHSYGSWKVTTAATCDKKGVETRTCSGCSKSETRSISTTGHSYGSWKVTKSAGCVTTGTETKTCSKCSGTQTRSIDPTGHTMGSWSTTKKATCDTNGTKTRKCSACGHTETETIAATGHNWDEGKVTTTPTSCSDMGIKTYTCKTCGKTKTEQIKGSHTFGEWEYEEYTYQQQDPLMGTWHDRVSHRKVRTCTKCGYMEYGNTPDHSCKKGSSNHTVTTIKEGTCATPAKMRSTCKVCGWYVDYDGKKSSHTDKTEPRHLTDYGAYTNELDAIITTCTTCGDTDVTYVQGEGRDDYNRYEVQIAISGGASYSLEHPEYQTVRRNFVYDANGYVKQFTVYWWYNGQRYNQVINCDKASMIAWFAEHGMTTTGSETFHIKASGTKVQPYRISWTS